MKKLFSVHKGRTDRAHFFIGLIFWALVLNVILFAIQAVGSLDNSSIALLLLIPLIAIEFYIIYLGICLWIRRLHDINKSGWWILLNLIPLFNLFFFVYMIYRAGDKSANKYGEKPQSVLV